jgi:hypothetical protein
MSAKQQMTGWKVCPGDSRWVQIPMVVKPINCGSADRARLIAAAPELLAACKDALWALDNMSAILNWAALESTLQDPRPAMRAAIAKASPSTTADAGVAG